MMSTGTSHSSKRSVKSSIGLVALLIASSLGMIISAPIASASVSGDYEVTSSVYPIPDTYMSSWDPISLTVEVSNTGFFYNSQPRTIEWFVCEGSQTEIDCYNDREEYGIGSIEPIQVGQATEYTFSQPFNPNGDEGEMTLVFRFVDSDTNTTNDVGMYTFYLSRALVDVEFDPQNPIEQITDVAIYDETKILNTDVDYNMSISGIVTSCGSCGLVADLGWKIIDTFGVERANSTVSYSNLPNWGEASFSRDMPPLNFDSEGTFTMVFGIFGSTGTPNGDMNSYNNLQSVSVTFDDTVDLQISSMFPLNAPASAKYFYGNDSVAVTVANLGNHSVEEPLVRFTVSDLDDQMQSEEDCRPEIILPGETYNCVYDIAYLGDKKLKVFVSEALNEGLDAKPSDNVLSVVAEIIQGDISPLIEQTNFYGTYKTADTITFSAKTLATAANPLSYSWWMGGIIPLGTGQEITVPASTIGLGDHFISVRVTDSLGTMESASSEITIFNSTDIGIGDWLNGSAVTRTHAASVGYYGYPISNVNYGAGEGLEPLLRFSIDVVSTTEIPDAGMDWMEFDLNLTELIPDNVPRDSIAIHQLEDYEQLRWDPLDGQNSFQLIDNNTLRVYIVENMDLLLVGDLPSPDINLENPILTPLPDGEMQLDWNSSGDLDNPYFGGWKIYRVTSPITASAFFPNPEDISSEFVWRGLMADSLSANLTGDVNQWVDERQLETGTCSSYAVIPVDRSGEPDYMKAKVSLVDGSPGLTCGDAIDPSAEVTGFSSNVVYNNSTSCLNKFSDLHRCYELTLSWTWPDNEPQGELSWNLYRIEQRPDNVDLRYIDPIATNLANVPGEKGTFIELGTDFDGIKPYRTYYYILTPLDSVGNEYTIIDYPSKNVERVYIEDRYWEYNEYRVPEPPEPPEPPYGVQWLGDLNDYMQVETFQIAGIIMVLTIMINFIAVPLILMKRKRMARVLAKRAANQPRDLDDEFEDFFK